MKKNSYITIMITILVISSCKPFTWDKVNARKNLWGHLIGIANKNSFKNKSFNDWFTKSYKNYKVDTITTNKIDLENIKIITFMGTWCEDSQKEIPRFYKILDKLKFDYTKLKMVSLNKWKSARGLEEGFNIEKIPTFVIYKNNKEVGRIIEHPKESIEKDLLQLIKKH